MKKHMSKTVGLALFLLGLWATPIMATDINLAPVARVKQHLGLDTRIHVSNIQVSEKGEKVILTGTVESLAEKSLVEEIVRRSVGENYSLTDLNVNPPLVPDYEIQRNIATAVPAHCQVEIHDFQIEVQNGNVTLRGGTNALHHQMMAEHVAANTRGVRNVTNHIRVHGPKESDKLIQENILSLLDPYVKGKDLGDISIAVKDGKVTLKGEYTNYEQQRYIKEVAQNVPGVVAVKSELRKQLIQRDYIRGDYGR